MEKQRVIDYQTEVSMVEQAGFSRLYKEQYFVTATGINLEEQAENLYQTVQVTGAEIGKFLLKEDDLVHIIEFPDQRSKVKIGRAPNCEVIVPAEYKDVSAGHAFLKMEEGGICIMDVSKNGIYLAGRRIPAMTNVRVPDGTLVGLSKSYQIGVYSPDLFYRLLQKFFEDLKVG